MKRATVPFTDVYDEARVCRVGNCDLSSFLFWADFDAGLRDRDALFVEV